MAIADRHGLPVSLHVVSASPNEATLVEATLDRRFLARNPERMIGDNAYDSDPLDGSARYRACNSSRLTIGTVAIPHPRWPRAAPLPSPLENRASVCLAP